MSTVNASTGFSPFALWFGVTPRVVPPIVNHPASDIPTSASDVIEHVIEIEREAKDNLLAAKIAQTVHVNAHRGPEMMFNIGDSVYLSTSNRRKEYMHTGDNRVAKFMPRFDGPYEIIRANKEKSLYTLNMPNAENTFPTFHSSHLCLCVPNLLPSRELARPAAITGVSGDDEYFVESIIDEKCGRRGMEYLVIFRGYGPEDNRWMPRREVEELEALDRWLERPKKTPSRTRGKAKKISVSVLISLLEALSNDIDTDRGSIFFDSF